MITVLFYCLGILIYHLEENYILLSILKILIGEIKNILKDVKLINNIARKVWAYDSITLDLIKGSPLQYKIVAFNILGISRNIINYFLNSKTWWS